MNTEQLKTDRTKEEILNDAVHGDELYFPYWRVKHRIEKAMQDFASQESKKARIEENESMLAMAKLHGTDERMIFVISERLRILKSLT